MATEAVLDRAEKAYIKATEANPFHLEGWFRPALNFTLDAAFAFNNYTLPSGRDLWSVANQLGGYVGPGDDKHLAAFLIRESDAANELAEEIVKLRLKVKELESKIDP